MFSKACKYAIKALIYIASRSNDATRISLRDIAAKIDSPEHFTAKIMQVLSKQGIVSSIKGPNGGFYIENDAPPIKLLDVVRAIDGVQHLSGCGLGLKECSAHQPCPIHNEFSEIRGQMLTMLRENTIQQLAAELSAGHAVLKH
ncbi:MAG: Rrf2 family transcriptional regulator [Bacteroidales bacterium]|nr:Rrf2 family transcriptional regulator [Bacteroidales bacterium]